MKKIAFIILLIIVGIAVVLGVVSFNTKKNREYEIEEISEYKYYVLNKESGMGVIDIEGNIIVQPIYKSVKIPNPQKDIFICESNKNIVVLNNQSEQIFMQYNKVDAILLKGIVSTTPYEKSVLRYEKDGKYGLLNLEGKQITKPIYDEIEGLTNKEGELSVKKDEKYGVINCKGAVLIKPQYDTITGDGFYTNENKYKNSGYVVGNKTKDGYRYGYINYNLKKIMELEYSEVYRIVENSDISNTYIIANKEGKSGVIKNGEQLLDYLYQDIEYEKENKMFIVKRNSAYGVFDLEGREILQVKYDQIEEAGIYLAATKDDKTEYYDLQGNKVLDFKYKFVNKTESENYYITINDDEKYGVINKNKDQLIKNEYSYIEYLYDNYFIVANKDGELGVIDENNKTIINFKYDVLQKIGSTKVIEAKIIEENKSELYSEELKLIISMKNATVKEYESYIKIFNSEQTKYFDITGKEKKNTQIFVDNELFAMQKGKKWGFVNKNNETIVEFKYDKVTEFDKYGFAGICIDNKWGVINKKGEIIVTPQYEIEEQEPEFIDKYYKVYYGYGQSYFTDK